MKRVLIVDDNRENFETLSKYITQEGHVVQNATDFEGALHRLKAWKPHLVLIDADCPSASSYELVPKIRLLTQDEYVTISLVTSQLTLENVDRGFEAGVDDYLLKPLQEQFILQRLRSMLRIKEAQDSLKRAYHRIEELSSTDELTGLINMRAAYRKGEEEILRCRRSKKPVSAFLLNLDDFSGVNQNYGFAAGSYVLQEVALRLKQCLRNVDLVSRVGADEFFILLCDTDLAGAEFVAERVRDCIQSSPFKSQKQAISVTATLGVAGLTPDQTTQRMSDLLHITTEALKSAKANGTNRIEVYSFT